MKVVILNGPIGAGKDTIANLLVELCESGAIPAARWEFKNALWDAVGEEFNLGPTALAELKAWHNNRACKELPVPALGNISTRQALIYVSEEVYKPRFGKDVFGWHSAAALADLKECGYKLAVGSDGGFIEELRPISMKYDTYVFRLMGRGSFEGDSRRFLEVEETEQAGARCLVDLELVEGQPMLAVSKIMETLNNYK